MKQTNWLLLLTMCIGTFLCMLDTTVMNIALPAIQNHMNVPLSQLSWALNIYTITFAALTIPLARAADLLGRNKVYLGGLIIFAIGSFVSGQADVPRMLIIGRGVQSVGAAIIFPTSMTIAIATTPQAQRRLALLSVGLTQGLAATLGPTIGGIVTQFLGWRWVFYVNLPLVALALIGVLIQLPIQKEPRINAKVDYGGMLLLIITLLSLTMALTQGPTWGWSSKTVISLFVLTIGCLISFIFVEHHVTSPMIRLDLFKDRQFSGAAVTVILAGLIMVAVMVVMPTFFTQVQGKSELTAALLITPASLAIFIVSPISGTLVETLGPRIIILLGFVSMSISYSVLGFMDPDHYWQTFIGLACLGIGYGLVIGPITVLAASDFEGEKLTASQSVMGVLRQIGNILAVAIFISLLTSNISNAKTAAWYQVQTTVGKTSLPSTVKTAILTTAHSRISSDHVKTTRQHGSGITPAQTQHLIQKETQLAWNKDKVNQLPSQLQPTVKQKISRTVTSQVKATVAHDNGQVNQTTHQITTLTKSHITTAFLKLYQWFLPLTLLSVPVCLLFYRRRNYLRLLHRSHNAAD
ncbi:MFS transporter [Furfurilactobacillus curtus]|uniref:MFS transporter n=1 Tax=Furfurilactobacillus curtus TaxID=1746200 RepID=A0ABQ5JLT5_9LACO